jgi:hypothetical protein
MVKENNVKDFKKGFLSKNGVFFCVYMESYSVTLPKTCSCSCFSQHLLNFLTCSPIHAMYFLTCFRDSKYQTQLKVVE